MSNFQFLTPEFKPLFEPAKGAEQVEDSRDTRILTAYGFDVMRHDLRV